jgi:hypothetical protein
MPTFLRDFTLTKYSLMIDYEAFSALRMRHLFPIPPQSSRSFYDQDGPERRSYDEEYLGGSWDSEVIDGVFLWYPKAGAGKLGSLEAWASREGEAIALPGKPGPYTGPFTDPIWSANANVALAALGLPVRIGSSESDVRALSNAPIKSLPYPDGSRNLLSITRHAPDLYYLKAVVHPTDGLLTLKVFRPDMVTANCSRSARKYFEDQWK